MTDDPQLERRFNNLLTKGTRALRERDLPRAVMLLERACQLKADDPDAALNLSGAYILSKQFAPAVQLLERLRQQHPQNIQVWTNLGAAYLGDPRAAREEDQQKAIEAFQQALTIDARAPNVAYNLGLIYRDRREYREARRWFHQVVETNPQDRDARDYIDQMTQKLGE